MVNPGDIKIVPPITQTYGTVANSTVPCWRFFYFFRDQGPFPIVVPMAGFSWEKLQAAIIEQAGPLSDVPLQKP